MPHGWVQLLQTMAGLKTPHEGLVGALHRHISLDFLKSHHHSDWLYWCLGTQVSWWLWGWWRVDDDDYGDDDDPDHDIPYKDRILIVHMVYSLGIGDIVMSLSHTSESLLGTMWAGSRSLSDLCQNDDHDLVTMSVRAILSRPTSRRVSSTLPLASAPQPIWFSPTGKENGNEKCRGCIKKPGGACTCVIFFVSRKKRPLYKG